MGFLAVFAGPDILLVLGVVLFWWSYRMRKRQERVLATPAAVGRAVTISLVGLVLFVAGLVVFLIDLAPPLAGALLILAVAWIALCSTGQFRRIHVESVTTFRCSPDKAFALLADPRKQPLYVPEIERIEVLSPGEIGVGTVCRAWVRIPGAPGRPGLFLVADDEIVAYEPSHTYASRIVGKATRSRTVFTQVEGGTQVIERQDDMIEFQMAVTGGVLFRREAEQLNAQHVQKTWERARALLEEPAA